jgi:hypothetical protein
MAQPSTSGSDLRMSMPIWDIPPIPRRGDDSRDVVYEAVGRALSYWENFELELACLYATFIGLRPPEATRHPDYAKARIFRERADVIDRGGKGFFIKRSNQELEKRFDDLICEARLAAARRNDIAHGVVNPIWSTASPGIETFMLLPSTYRHKDFDIKARARYAFSSKEINGFASRFQEIQQRVFILTEQIILAMP